MERFNHRDRGRKARIGANRLQVEHLECRVQPGSMLPFGEFSLMGTGLFGEEPRREHAAARQQGMADLESMDLGTRFSFSDLRSGTYQVGEALPPAGGGAVAVPQREAEAQALQSALQILSTPQQLGSKLAGVTSELQPLSSPGMQPISVTSTRALTPRQMAVRVDTQKGTGNEGGGIAAITLYTSFWGYGGTDGGNAVATDDSGNGYVAGFTSAVSGTKDIRVSVTAPDGTALLGDYYGTDFDAGGDEEALAIALDPEFGGIWITGYAFNGIDNDMFVAQVDPFKGTLVGTPMIFDSGLGDDRGTGIRFASGLMFVTGDVANGSGTDAFAAAFITADMAMVFANAYQLGGNTTNQVNAIEPTPDGGYSYLVGTTNDGTDHLWLGRVNTFDGNMELSSVRQDVSIGGGVAVNIENNQTMVYVTGNVFVPTPQERYNGVIQKFQDTGKAFTPIYGGFITASIAEGPIDITGTDLRVSAAGKAYVMTEWHWPLCCGLPYRDRDAHVYKVNVAGSAYEDQYHWGIDLFEALGVDSGNGLALNGTVVTVTGYAGTTPAPGGFPVTPGAFQTDHGDGVADVPDGFVSRIDLNNGG